MGNQIHLFDLDMGRIVVLTAFSCLLLLCMGDVSASAPPVVLFSSPKCGTHLATKVISLMTGAIIQDQTGGLGSTREDSIETILLAHKKGRIVSTHPWGDV